MPTFTVTVKDDKTGNTKKVTVNTDGMVATVVSEEPVTTTVVEPTATSVTAPVLSETEPTATSVTAPAVPAEVLNDANEFSVLGGKRSASLFRLKKRRITRKLKKTL